MKVRPSHNRLNATLIALIVLVSSALLAPAPTGAAAGARQIAPTPTAASTTNAITPTTPMAPPITSASGLTVLLLPQQVVSGARLSLQVRSLAGAHVTVTIAFPDGTSLVASQRLGPSGVVTVSRVVSYQPQGSAEAASVTVVAQDRRQGLHDSVQGSVTVLQRIVLIAHFKMPRYVTVGQRLAVAVTTNVPGVWVRFLVIYPDGQQELRNCGYSNGAGVALCRVVVSASHGKRGVLQVQVWLSYAGVERRIPAKALLRPRA